jgi:dienelactone hydrolase
MVADAIELYDWAARRADVDPERIVLHGRSLGTGVAVQVAAARPARCTILTSPFASAREVAAEIYFWAPIGMIMRHPFDSLAHAPHLRMPALFLIGEADTLIPARYSNRLADAWAGPVERVSFAGMGHNDVSVHPAYAAAMQAFLARCL